MKSPDSINRLLTRAGKLWYRQRRGPRPAQSMDPRGHSPEFRAFMTRLYWEWSKAGKEILRALAVGLDLGDGEYLVKQHSGHNNQLRLLHYPRIAAEELEREKERPAHCQPHTDWSSMTMLFQDDCGGLEIEDVTRLRTFIPAKPVKNAMVMNVGDLLQRWSNGCFFLRDL
jgi:isopenicillin N synthase-like dioxygenase